MLDRLRQVHAMGQTKVLMTAARWALLLAVGVYLITRLSQIGWSQVAANLPAAPLFYVFFIAKYLTLPVTELFVYQKVWDRSLRACLAIFVRKRVYNYAVVSYSGEAFLAHWAQKYLNISPRAAMVGVKDANILAAFTANIATLIFIAGLAALGVLTVGLDAMPGGYVLFGSAFMMATGAILVVTLFHKRLIALTYDKIRSILLVHFVRQLVLILFFVGMYASALPGEVWSAYLIFVALYFVISRIPFLPNLDLVYLGAALSLAPVLKAPEEAVAGLLIAEAALAQLFNAGLFMATTNSAQRVKLVAASNSR